MKNEIKGFTFYKSYYKSLKNLKEKDKKDIINAMLEYVFEDKKPNFKGIKFTIWTLIEPNLNTSKNRSNINSGAPKGNKNASKEKQSKNNQISINDLKDKDKDKDKDKEREIDISTFTTPTLTDIILYSSEKGIDDETYCKKFFNYYQGTGWKAGNSLIVDWKSKFEEWIEKDRNQINFTKKEEVDEAGFKHVNGRRVF
jgi:hypothetical protein